jgi:subtilase family serine protease
VKRGTTDLTKIVVTSSHGVLKDITTQHTVSKKTMYPLHNNATDLNFNITTEGSVEVKRRTENTPIKPLMIGVGVGVAIGLIIVFGAIYIYLKKRRKDDAFEDEMEPIAKNAVYD